MLHMLNSLLSKKERNVNRKTMVMESCKGKRNGANQTKDDVSREGDDVARGFLSSSKWEEISSAFPPSCQRRGLFLSSFFALWEQLYFDM